MCARAGRACGVEQRRRQAAVKRAGTVTCSGAAPGARLRGAVARARQQRQQVVLGHVVPEAVGAGDQHVARLHRQLERGGVLRVVRRARKLRARAKLVRAVLRAGAAGPSTRGGARSRARPAVQRSEPCPRPVPRRQQSTAPASLACRVEARGRGAVLSGSGLGQALHAAWARRMRRIIRHTARAGRGGAQSGAAAQAT